MKKKFLSLMMAAAVVATTSVSAFAQDKVINGLDTQEHTTDVTITGKVLDQNNNEPAGNFNITVPTSAAFTVGKDQKVISAMENKMLMYLQKVLQIRLQMKMTR